MVFSDTVWAENTMPGGGNGAEIEPGTISNIPKYVGEKKLGPSSAEFDNDGRFVVREKLRIFSNNDTFPLDVTKYSTSISIALSVGGALAHIYGVYNYYPNIYWRINYGEPIIAIFLSSARFLEFNAAKQNISYNGVIWDASKNSILSGEEIVIAPADTAGRGFIMAGDNEERSDFWFSSTGVDLLNSSANIANSDTTGKICVFRNASNELVIKNNLADYDIIYDVKYKEN